MAPLQVRIVIMHGSLFPASHRIRLRRNIGATNVENSRKRKLDRLKGPALCDTSTEEAVMRRMCSALVLSATLAGPISAAPVFAAPVATGEPAVVVRVYDPYRHDYHRWDRAEQARYREYLRERHRSYIAYQHQRAAERRAYWHWRHEHEEHER